MSILWDAPLTAAVARELHDELTGNRLRALRMDRESRNLVLHFRDRTLIFRLHPLHGDVALLGGREPGPGSITFKAHCRRVHAPPDERLLMLQLQPPAGGSSPEGIVIELMTNQWNAVWLTVGDDRIRRVLWKRTLKERVLAPGEIYQPPAPSQRRGIDESLTEEEWTEILGSVDPGKRRGTLLRNVAFTSSLNAAALLGLSGDQEEAGIHSDETAANPEGIPADPDEVAGDPDETAGDPGRTGARAEGTEVDPEGSLRRGYRLWKKIRAVALGEEPIRPFVLETPKRRVPYPLRLPGSPGTPAPSLLEAFEQAVDQESGEAQPDAALLPSSLLERLERAVARARTKADRLREELSDTPDPDRIRRLGDLILARYSEVSRGTEKATLEGFDGEPVEVELDPALSAGENADRYYNEAARIERARTQLPKLIQEAEQRAEELRSLQEKAQRGEVSPEALEDELPDERQAGPAGDGRRGERGGRGSGSGPREQAPGRPYKKYRSSGGLEIRVGRGAKANDDLTFHHSNPDDVWLHARQVAGAHVILRWHQDGSPPPRDLAEAASLAALHSDARHASSVPVDWTRRKYVRSPRKSPPGVVVPDRVKTVFVDPDPKLEKRLRES